MRSASRTLLAMAGAVLTSTLVGAQAPAATPIVGTCNFSPIVSDLDKAIAFYQDVLGLEVPAAPQGRPFDSTTPVLDMLGVHGAEMRWVTARVPGSRCGIEIVEFGKLERAALKTNPQDPGATTLVLFVRDIEPILSRAKAAGVTIVTTGGAPVAVDSEGGKAVLLREPDGHYVELLQSSTAPETTAPATANVVGWRPRFSVASTDEALRLYRDQFGFETQLSTPTKNSSFMALNGLADTPVRLTVVSLPGGGRLDLAEYSGVPRTPVRARIQDPGATRFQLQASDVRAAVALAQKTGASIISQGGDVVALQGGTQAVVARDANNLFLVMFASAPRPQK